jgi:DNA-binding response OmpR family regulator
MEDWIHLGASDEEIAARVKALEQRWRMHHPAMPELDADGLLRFRGAWVALTPVESRLAKVLLDRMGTVVSRQAILRAGWREGEPARNVLDVHILRLRRRMAPLGLSIKTFRGRGYLMEEEIPQ